MKDREPGQGEPAENEAQPLFELGQVVATPNALQSLALAEQNPLDFVHRHVTGDWGDLPEEDIAENERSVEQGYRVFSAYMLETGSKIWVITEHDRSVTTILLPSDY